MRGNYNTVTFITKPVYAINRTNLTDLSEGCTTKLSP